MNDDGQRLPPHAPVAADAALLARALEGDEAAVDELVDTLAPVVHARVARTLANRGARSNARDPRQEVEDFVQEVFAALFEARGRALRAWQPARGLSLKNFVGLIAERETLSLLRLKRRNPFTEDPTLASELDEGLHDVQGVAPAAEQGAISRELCVLLLEQLYLRLSPLGLHLFQALIVEEQSVDDVGARTGLSRDALYTWKTRLLKLARAVLGEIDTEAPRVRTPSPAGVRR